MQKILKKYTTIPKNLYVSRDADRQLKQIIEDMQRPGYVLVARQMGKTNLLLNAKRTLESENRLFVYIDLSNSFLTDRQCYRNIIDTIIELHEDTFGLIVAEIDSVRGRQLLPHKEYESSLRVLLKTFKGDMVIILDEIDGLRSSEYSDNFFAQIRSNYFSRTNFPEFERLTYILSGVIEPTDLIKDKNKSPFNIGDKIYLDDFNFEEFKCFIKNSKLNISEEIIIEIYIWSKGNPRITFDLCSEVESLLINNENITTASIRDIVNNYYLTSFDLPPVDHIRELVKADNKIRESVLNIHKKNYSLITDELKRKLYLYGIISSSFEETSSFKNPIIEKSISESWIQSIIRESKTNLGYGLTLISQKDYKEAINAFKNHLENQNISRSDEEICNYYIGFSLFHLNEFEDAKVYLSGDFKNEDLYKNSKSYLGLCYARLGNIQLSKEIFYNLINEEANNFAYRNSVFNYAIFIRNENPNYSIQLLNNLHSIIKQQSEDEFSEDEKTKLITAINYYKAEIFYEINDLNAFNQSMEAALETATLKDKLYFNYFINAANETDKENFRNYIFETIIENNLLVESTPYLPYHFSRKHVLVYLDLLYDSKNEQNYIRLFNYSKEFYFNELNDIELAKLLDFNFDNDNCHFTRLLRSCAIDEMSKLENIRNILTYTINTGKSKKFEAYFKEYETLVYKLDSISLVDIHIFTHKIRKLIDDNQLDISLKLSLSLEKLFSDKASLHNLSQEQLLPIYYSLTQINFKLAYKDEVVKYADLTIRALNSPNSVISLDGELISEIQKEIEGLKLTSQFLINTSKIKERVNKYRPNDKVRVKYSNNTILIKKYKHISRDIINGLCTIVD